MPTDNDDNRHAEHHAKDDGIIQDNEFRISKSLQVFLILIAILLVVFCLTVYK